MVEAKHTALEAELLEALNAILAVIADARADDDVDCSTSVGGYMLGDVMTDAFYQAQRVVAKALNHEA